MDGIRVIHCADLHLGSKYSFLPTAYAELLQSEQLLCLERIVALANDGCDLLIIAGDIFDSVNVPDLLIKRVQNILCNLSPSVTVAICAGNHDPLCLGVGPLEKMELPKNVILFSDKNSFAQIEGKNLRIYSQSFTSDDNYENMLCTIHPDDNFINVGILHADLGAGTSSVYNPISVSDIQNCGLDYLALGHIHKRTDILKAGKTFYAYSGCVMGSGFDETDQKGVYIGTVSKNRCDMQFVTVAKRKFICENVDVCSICSQAQIIDKIKEQIDSKYTDSADNLYKIILTGEIQKGFAVDTAYIVSALSDRYFYIKAVDNTRIKIDLDALKNEKNLKGMFVNQMLERIKAEPDNELLGLALQIGLKSFDGEVKLNDD